MDIEKIDVKYFPNDIKSLKDSLKIQDGIIDVTLIENMKFMDRISDSTLQLTFRKLVLFLFCHQRKWL